MVCRSIVTLAAAPRRYEICVVSVIPSPFGVNPDGEARSAESASAPVGPASRESQVQRTVDPVPVPKATCCRAESNTVTVHGSTLDSLAEKLTRPPTEPSTSGVYSFGSPVSDACWATAPIWPYRPAPGQLVKPVSLWPETARSHTDRPLANLGLPLEIAETRDNG